MVNPEEQRNGLEVAGFSIQPPPLLAFPLASTSLGGFFLISCYSGVLGIVSGWW